MALLTCKGLTKSFSVRTLFTNIGFQIEQDDAIGLVGINGCGKTTLLKILRGIEPYDTGSISIRKGCRIGSLDQTIDTTAGRTVFETALTVFDELLQLERQMAEVQQKLDSGCPESARMAEKQARLYDIFCEKGGLTYRSRIRSACLGLGLSETDLERPVNSLSGGEARKVTLAMLLLREHDLLLLDEPTNHLDIAAVEWLEQYLLAYKGAFLVISHDRYFLDKVTRKTIEIENGHLLYTNGNYSTHVERKTDQRVLSQRHYDHQMREIRRIEAIIAQQKRWNQERNYVTIASKQKQIDRLKKDLVPPEPVPDELRFHFAAPDATGDEVLRTDHLTKGFGGRTLFRDVDLLVRKNSKVFLLGGNGTGKSTFLKLIRGEIEPDGGSFVIGANVRMGYYDQNVRCEHPRKTIFDDVYDSFPFMDPKQIRNTLAQFLFRGDDVFKEMGSLSGGELARVQLLKLMMSGCNFLILDEPTNHLDIASREALENALSEYGGTMLIVSHDRYFINRIADRVLVLHDGVIESIEGDYESCREWIVQKNMSAEREKTHEASPQNEYVRIREARARLSKLKSELNRTERSITEMEVGIEEAEKKLLEPEIAHDYEASNEIYTEMERMRGELDALYERWESIGREIESTEVE